MCGHSTGKGSIPFILVSLAPVSHCLAGARMFIEIAPETLMQSVKIASV